MSTARRLTAALAASALTWVGLSFVVTTPGAQADTDERDAGRTLTVTLKKGVAKFKIAKLPDGTRLKVKAKYAGDGQYAAGSAKKTFTLS